MSVLLGVVCLFAVLSLLLAVQQAVAINRAAPDDAQLVGFFPLGWWKFNQLRAKAGPAAAASLAIYERAVIAFLIFVVVGLILSGMVVTRAAPPASTAELINFNERAFAANSVQSIDLRRVALQPGALLES